MAREFKIKPMANRMVNVDLDLQALIPADAVYETANELLEAAYQSGAIQLIDEVMKRHRDRFVEVQSEWRLLDQVWRDLRLALGYDDSPNPQQPEEPMAGIDHDKLAERVTERQAPCTGCHPSKPDPRCVYPDGHVVHWDGDREIWLSPTVADDLALAEAEARGYQRAIDALREIADKIDRGPTFPVSPSVISALIREHAEDLAAHTAIRSGAKRP